MVRDTPTRRGGKWLVHLLHHVLIVVRRSEEETGEENPENT